MNFSPMNRRQMLRNTACGFGSLAFAAMAGSNARAAVTTPVRGGA